VAEKGQVEEAGRGLEHGRGIAAGATLTRDLANLPANVCTPTHLARQARELAKQYKTVRAEILDEPELKRLKMGSFLSVTAGTEEPAKLIVLRHNGGAKDEAPVVLVGKGVTFDTGGISLKQPPGMDEMKFDMTGAASVLGTIKAAAEIGLERNLVGVVPACENMPSGRATKPGDVVHSMSGQTIEVINTDAEGRLILCDALALADTERPDLLIDLATLTGAARIALGPELPALFGTRDETVDALLRHGRRLADPLWPMPLWGGYDDDIASKIADVNNASNSTFAGAIIGGLFLRRFVRESKDWLHVDLFGWNPKERPGRPVGAEPQVVRALYALLTERYG